MIELPRIPAVRKRQILHGIINGNNDSINKLSSLLPTLESPIQGKIQEEIKRIEAQTREAQETLITTYRHCSLTQGFKPCVKERKTRTT